MAPGTVRRTFGAASLVVFALTASDVVRRAAAHPNCIDDTSPDMDFDAAFCPEYDEGFCCNTAEETDIQLQYEAITFATNECAELYKEVACGTCHPYAGHLYERLQTGMTMTNEFCTEFYAECSEQLNLNVEFCNYHTGGDVDQFWSYPLVIEEEVFNGDGLVKAFPDVSDSTLPDEPIDMRMTPDGSKWWVLGLEGIIVEIDALEEKPDSLKLVMDISDDILYTYEEGLLSVAFSPGFHSTGVFYCSYVFGPQEFGANRLSRFVYDPSSPANTRNSEEVLITTTDKLSNIHSAGWIGFKPSAYEDDSAGSSHDLYWSIGDSGPQYDTSNNAQSPDTLHGSIVRVSVKSQINTGYSIPSSNPFAGGGGMGEICAQGFRNPYKCSFDRLNDDLYCGDVGHLDIETIKKVECGNNYGWRRFEGEKCMPDVEEEFPETCEDVDRSPYTFPEFSYCHSDYDPSDTPSYLMPNQDVCGDYTIVGSAVIGGFMYRGSKYGDLFGGNYIFSDFQWKHINHLYPENGGGWGYGVIYKNAKIVGWAEDNTGELYFLTWKGSVYQLTCGDICDGDDVNPVTPEPVPVEPLLSIAPTPAGTVAATTLPTTPAPTAVETIPPVVVETPAPVVGETPAPVAAKTPAPVAAETPAPVAVMPLPKGTTPAPTEPMVETVPPSAVPLVPATPAPVATADTPAPVAPVAPTASGLAYVHELIPHDAGAPLHPVVHEDSKLCDMDFDDVPMSGPSEAEVSPPDYLGCYMDGADEASDRLMKLAFDTRLDMTPLTCEAFCRDAGADMFGLQFGSQCFCGDSRDVDLDKYGETTCDRPCAGDSKASCGGHYKMDVYYMGGGPETPVGSTYLGCHADNRSDRLFKDAFLWCESSMTLQLCEQFCRGKGSAAYGLQYQHECWCGDGVDLDQNGPGICAYRCSGDDLATCGGYDSLSVYAID